MIGSLLQVVGFVCLVIAAFTVAIPLGLAAVGVACVVVGYVLEPSKKEP